MKTTFDGRKELLFCWYQTAATAPEQGSPASFCMWTGQVFCRTLKYPALAPSQGPYMFQNYVVCRAVASLTVPGGQEFHFPHFSPKFSSNFSHFLPHFGSPGGRVAHPGRPWLRHWLYVYKCIMNVAPSYLCDLITLFSATLTIENRPRLRSSSDTTELLVTRSRKRAPLL